MMSHSPTRLSSIQMLRGLAALLVVFHHCAAVQRRIIRDAGFETLNDVPFGFWDNSFAGVDVFFVISGFIMVHVTAPLAPSFQTVKHFLIARFIRIYPVWWIYLGALGLAYMFIYGVPVRPDHAVESGGSWWLYGIYSFFLIPQYVPPVLQVGWTLVYELYFYLIFAVFLLFSRRILPLFLGLWVTQIIIFNVVSLPFTPMFNLLKGPLSLEFIMGAVAALIWQKMQLTGALKTYAYTAQLSLIMGCVSFCAGLVLNQYAPGFWGEFGRVGLFGVPSALILYGLASLEQSRSWIWPRWSVILGDMSYSLYLGHVITLTVIRLLWQAAMARGLPASLHVGAPGIFDNLLFAFVGISASIIVAWIGYFCLERPLIRKLKNRFHPR